MYYLLFVRDSFIRPHLDSGDAVYDQPDNESFIGNLEKLNKNQS